MTATVVLDLVSEMSMKWQSAKLTSQVKILPNAALLIGTTAHLLAGDLITVEEVLYGMMLPSGNDAA